MKKDLEAIKSFLLSEVRLTHDLLQKKIEEAYTLKGKERKIAHELSLFYTGKLSALDFVLSRIRKLD